MWLNQTPTQPAHIVGMALTEIFAAINRMQTDGVIDRYAIGGAVAATLYLEPVATLDVEVFVALQLLPGQLLLSSRPIYDYLTDRGARVEGQYLVIGSWPVQFLPAPSPLVEEAILEARQVDVGGEPVRIFTAEHLAVIALEVGRAKDKARLVQFVEAGVLDALRFDDILSRHGLRDRWRQFEREFFRDRERIHEDENRS